jgi:hypothetical protein
MENTWLRGIEPKTLALIPSWRTPLLPVQLYHSGHIEGARGHFILSPTLISALVPKFIVFPCKFAIFLSVQVNNAPINNHLVSSEL